MSERETATLEFFDEEKGFGFLRNLNGKDWFLHQSDLEGDRYPKKSHVIEFTPAETEKGLKAKDAKIIEQPD